MIKNPTQPDLYGKLNTLSPPLLYDAIQNVKSCFVYWF